MLHHSCFPLFIRRNFLCHNSAINSTKRLSTATDEKSVPELSENERKLAAEVETLTKDLAGLKERCSELDVRYVHWVKSS